jgi:hypothetical protein
MSLPNTLKDYFVRAKFKKREGKTEMSKGTVTPTWNKDIIL